MVNFKYSSHTQVNFFLNEKALTILYILNNNPNLLTGEYLNLLNQEEDYIGKSQFYRYINTFERYNLIKIKPWKKRLKGFGHVYEIKSEGREVLNFISKHFEE